LRAKKRVQTAKKILDKVGIGGERLEMFNLSAAMGQQYAAVATEMTDRVRQLGPNPLKLKQKVQRDLAPQQGGGTRK